MMHKVVIYESPTKYDRLSIQYFIGIGVPVFIIEPFHSYHHKKGILFFPPHLPIWARHLIDRKKITILNAEKIKAHDIYMMAADKAVKVVESVYQEYRADYLELISLVSKCLGSSVAEDAFKNHLCNTIAEFFSVNIMLQRIDKFVDADEIYAIPDTNIILYQKIKRLIKKCDIDYFESSRVRFPKKARIFSHLDSLRKSTVSTLKIFFQCVASGLIPNDQKIDNGPKKVFSFGISILGPRQLRGGKRGPDFLIDYDRILPEEVVYIPQIPLTEGQHRRLAQYPGHIYTPPKTGKFFSNYREWKGLLKRALKIKWKESADEITVASNVLLNYFKWSTITKFLKIKHFVTHADFGPRQIGRNLALHQAGTTTWYFTDSMNHIVNFKSKDGCQMRHPFWTYLSYNNLVTWDRLMADYYKSHPGSFDKANIVGCLWSDHITDKENAQNENSIIPENLKSKFIVACFDSTFTMNGFTSYQEGILFAKHLRKIVDDIENIVLLFKEKKPRDIHPILDPTLGPKLMDAYDELLSHPRVLAFTNQTEASILISLADMVISFPFTSTTFEALSANKPGIWHDPKGNYRNSIYSKTKGVVTHEYDELKQMINYIIDTKVVKYKNPLEFRSELVDPYRDKKAIDRFRSLLSSR